MLTNITIRQSSQIAILEDVLFFVCDEALRLVVRHRLLTLILPTLYLPIYSTSCCYEVQIFGMLLVVCQASNEKFVVSTKRA
ncbi:hypothetical protein [Nostoc sp.]|uniref:hypothetical protein n=1 Tax=Nostoc sp. TaxID=1180 RepID=UPI002FF6F2C5